MSRDFLTIKIWDIAMEGRGPVYTLKINEEFAPKLAELYESEAIFDKFEASFSADGTKVVTGSYRYEGEIDI